MGGLWIVIDWFDGRSWEVWLQLVWRSGNLGKFVRMGMKACRLMDERCFGVLGLVWKAVRALDLGEKGCGLRRTVV
jgi:hypothetical protein